MCTICLLFYTNVIIMIVITSHKMIKFFAKHLIPNFSPHKTSQTILKEMATTSNIGSGSPTYEHEYDRRKELEQFESTKLGVKGLVDSGTTRVPRIFYHQPQPETQCESQPDTETVPIPVIDMSGSRAEVVGQVREAAETLGFFQVINHGMPVSLLDRVVDGVRGFHELPGPEKAKIYRRDTTVKGQGVGFHSNYDLFWSKGASWRDTLEVRTAPVPVVPDDIPHVCREEVMEWDKEVKQLGERLMELLSEGLGLNADRLKGIDYMGRRSLVGHYYPYCPEPNKTIGITSHTDPGVLTVLLQDQVGGLQVKHQGKWLDLKPVHGALVVNIGDMFQMISNDIYKSGEHRVVANATPEPRVSIVTFLGPGVNDNVYGPLPELVSPENPALYREFRFRELLTRFLTKELEGKSMVNYFRL